MNRLKKQEEERVVKDMSDIIVVVRPPRFTNLKPGSMLCNGKGLNRYCCDEVYPNIFIGDWHSAKRTWYLKQIGVTHVLNAAEGMRIGFGMVNTGNKFYNETEIKYKGIRNLRDLPLVDISHHFNESVEFIDEAISSGGKILVHCHMGVSRSGTLVIVYLMTKHNMTACDALRRIRHIRYVRPNNGFIDKIAELDVTLKHSRKSKAIKKS